MKLHKIGKILGGVSHSLGSFLAVVVFAVPSVYATAPAAPTVTTVAYVNGKMNIAVWYKDSAYGSTSGSGLWDYTYEVEMKRGDEGWTDVTANGTLNSYNVGSLYFRTWTMATNYIGEAEYRIRAKNKTNSETSDWVETGAVKATVNVKGTPIYSNGVSSDSKYENGFDGYIHTMVDGASDGQYIGYIFDEPTRIKAIRFLPRIEHQVSSYIAQRYQGSCFQTAPDATFAVVETVYTVPNDFSSVAGMAEVVFPEPITANAIRHYKAANGYESTAELEFIPADMPLKPSISFEWTDFTNFYPVVTWTFPANFCCSTCRLERAIHKEGPWVAQSDWLDSATDSLRVTNDDLYVGIPYYYRVAAYTDHPDFAGQLVYSAPSEYTRMRRIDRSWTDQSHLYDGISIMQGTNDAFATGNKPIGLAFDGKANTWPDLSSVSATYHGPVGLNFGTNVWVGAFGYICRNDNACYERISNVALYSASGEDVELLDKVQRSANVSQYSQSTTFYCEPVTVFSAEGERCWFLYGNGNGPYKTGYLATFYCNVAEVAFFGWTAADKANAPVVTAPATLTFARGATGPVVSWAAGNNVQSYVLKRRPYGETEWTTVETVSSGVLSYTDAGLGQGYYEYCVEADGGELGTATSAVIPYRWYTAGNGTGLSGVVMWPYTCTNSLPWQMTQWAARGPEAVNLNLGGADEIAAGISAHARIAWEGKLIVPFDGIYTFALEADSGGAVSVDGEFAANNWTDGSKVVSGNLTLTAGEHDIRVDYRLAEGDSPAKKCILRWGGMVPDEVIPASQLVPAVTPPAPQLDGWTCLTYAMDRVGQFVKTEPGTYNVTASSQQMGDKDHLNSSFMWKRMPDSFAVEAKVKLMNYGCGGIMIQSEDGYFVSAYLESIGANSYCGVRKFFAGDSSWSEAVAKTNFTSDVSNRDCYLRVEKRWDAVRCMWKDGKSDSWTELYTCVVSPASLSRDDVAVGFMACGNNKVATSAKFEFSEIKLREIKGMTLIVW